MELFGRHITKIEESDANNNGGVLPNNNADDESIALAVVNEWLGFIADAIMGLIVLQIVKISKLTRYGAMQLSVDIEYIGYV